MAEGHGALQATRRYTPPVDVQIDYGRSPGLRVVATIWPSHPKGAVARADGGSSLTVAGAALALTNFPLGPRYWVSEEP